MRRHEHGPAGTSQRAGRGGVRRTPGAGTPAEQLLGLQSVIGNAAMTRLLRPQASAPEPQAVTVQRAAWVGGRRVDASEEGLTPEMRALAEDRDVHDYHDEDEFRRHAAGQTDYLGNLRHSHSLINGTWVRFPSTGLNVIGENHKAVTLAEVVAAVGSRSFIYELFPVDDLSANPATVAALRSTNPDSMADFAIGENDDIRQHGAESLFPKLGFAFQTMVDRMTPTGPPALKGYFGERLRTYVVIAWAYAGEVHAEVEARARQSGVADEPDGRHRAEAQLAKFYESQQVLGEFVQGLRDGDVGTSLEAWQAAHPSDADQVVDELREFGRDVVELMTEKMNDDAGLTAADRAAIGAQQGIDRFRHWRDVTFRESVLSAHARGVRYAGMGANHMKAIRDSLGATDGIHFHDYTDEDLKRDIVLTQVRAQQRQLGR